MPGTHEPHSHGDGQLVRTKITMSRQRLRDVRVIIATHILSFLVVWYFFSWGTMEWERIENGLHIMLFWTATGGLTIGFISLAPLHASWSLPARVWTFVALQLLGYFLLFVALVGAYPIA